MGVELLLWLRAAPWPLGSLSAAFHHAERAPRVTSSLTAESSTIQKLQNILGVDIGISPPGSYAQGGLVNACKGAREPTLDSYALLLVESKVQAGDRPLVRPSGV